MQSFSNWLTEGTRPVLTHLTHVEDLVLTKFATGAQEALKFLNSVASKLQGKSAKSTNITVKIDGSPSLVCGLDPADGKFFVGTKGVFSKIPKIAKSHADINSLYEAGLSDKMHVAFDELKGLSWPKILQGDLLFTRAMLRKVTVDGVDYITFKPNLIVYGVTIDSVLGQQILNANFGICFHTSYTGTSLGDIKVIPGADTSKSHPPATCLLFSNLVKDVSGSMTLTADQTTRAVELLGSIRTKGSSLASNKFLALCKQVPLVQAYIMQFQNSLVRAGTKITLTPESFAASFIEWLKSIEAKERAGRSTVKGQTAVQARFASMSSAVLSVEPDLIKVTDWQNDVIELKNLLMSKLNVAAALETFYQTNTGIVSGNGEGFVISDKTNRMIKLVDRNSFSRMNLTK